MASEQDHLAQARHNAALAEFLAQDMVYKDWVITAAFYAAVHYVEAMFARDNKWHAENEHGDTPPHIWRLQRLHDKSSLAFVCYVSYKRLYDASKQVRYLELWGKKGGIALDYFSDHDVLAFIKQDLTNVKQELGYK